MRKSFCDCCGNETTEASTRAFKALSVFHGSEIGLGAQLTVNGQMSVENFICTDCMADLLIKAVKTMPATKAALFVDDASKTAKLREELEERNLDVAKKQRELDQTLVVYEERMKKAEQRMKEDSAEIASLANQVRLVQETAEKRVQLLKAQHEQELVDRQDNPEYVESVARREAKRASGK